MLALSAAVLSLLAFSVALPQEKRAATHDITVGGPNGELAFTPDAIFANPGDQVIFHFQQKNHSATQSSFANPCGRVDGGFDSGFMPVAAGVTSDFPTFTYTVENTKPVWVYCAQNDGGHCHAGMVFAINCGATGSVNSFDNFKAAAIAQGQATSSSAYGYGAPAASSDSAPPASSAPPADGAPAATAAATTVALPDTTTYPGITIPPAPQETTVTSTIVVGTSTWTTTYASYPGSPDPTPSSLTGSTINVVVGGNGTLTFDPPFVSAKPFDTVVFSFQAKNHTATQSSFSDPCRKLEFTDPGVIGFDSGFMPVTAGSSDFPTFSVVVNDTAPIWVYCRQTGHCGEGMVFAINSVQDSARNFAAFQTLAKDINGTSTLAANGTATNGTAPSTSQPGSATRFSASVVLGVASVALGTLLL